MSELIKIVNRNEFDGLTIHIPVFNNFGARLQNRVAEHQQRILANLNDKDQEDDAGEDDDDPLDIVFGTMRLADKAGDLKLTYSQEHISKLKHIIWAQTAEEALSRIDSLLQEEPTKLEFLLRVLRDSILNDVIAYQEDECEEDDDECSDPDVYTLVIPEGEIGNKKAETARIKELSLF